MAYTRAQWNRFQAELPEEDRMSYEEYIASETPASTSTTTATATATTTATATVTPTATETPALSAAEIARLKAIEDAANADYKRTLAAAKDADFGSTDVVAPKDGVKFVKLGSNLAAQLDEERNIYWGLDPKAGGTKGDQPIKRVSYQPIDSDYASQIAIRGWNWKTGKPNTKEDTIAAHGGYDPTADIVGWRLDPATGEMQLLNKNGSVGMGAEYYLTSKGVPVPKVNRDPNWKGFRYDELGRWVTPDGKLATQDDINKFNAAGGLQGDFFGTSNTNPGLNSIVDSSGKVVTGFDAKGNPVYNTSSNTSSAFVSTNTNFASGSGLNIPTGVTVTTTYVDPRTGDTIGVLSNGTTRVLTAGNKLATERESTIATLMDRFNKYGLTGLANKIKQLAVDGATEATITLQLQETPEYQQRFAANAERLKKGLSVLTPAEYVNVEDSYRQVLRAYGLKQFDNDAYVKQFISNDVSPTELSNRVVTAVQRVQNADPAIINQLKQYYGITSPDMVAYVLDPEQQFQKIERQVAAAEIGVAAARQGLTAGVSVAEQLAAQGVSQAEAQKGYATIADILPTAEKLSDIYGTTLDGYRQDEGEQEVFNQLASAQRKRQKLTAREVAAFSGSAGAAKTSLSTSRVGQF